MSDVMALTVSENSFTGSLEGSDSNESERSESYAMYLTVGEGGYEVSTAMFGTIDPGEDADTEDEGQVSNTSFLKEQETEEETNIKISYSPYKETSEKSSEDPVLTLPDTSKTEEYFNSLQCTDSKSVFKSEVGIVDDFHPNDSGKNSSETENYSINSDDNGESNEMELDNNFDGPPVNDQQETPEGCENDFSSVTIKTEPESPVDSDSSTEDQSFNTKSPGNFDPNISPSKAFALRLNLFKNKPVNNSDNIDFQTLDHVVAAAVSKTYNKETDVNGSNSQSKHTPKVTEAVAKKSKPVEETRSGVVVVDVPVHVDGKLFHGCSICHKMFKTPKELRVHSRVHTKEKPYACYVCGKAFRQQAHLNSHYKIHSGEKPYSCNLCSLSFTENSSLKRHIRIHLGIKPYKCDQCDDAFVTSYLLKTHKTRRHEEKQNRTRFECDRCPKVYTSKETFNKHMRSHNPDTRISCSYCGQVCLTSSHLKRHINVHKRTDLCNLQTKDKPYECGICQKKYFNKKHLEQHVVRHTQTELFSCDNCDKSFDSRYKWKRHVRRSHSEKIGEPEIFSCDTCDKSFDSRYKWKRHVQRTHGEKTDESQLFKCLMCSKVFRSNENLESHIKGMHDKSMIYDCDLSDGTFLRRNVVLNHKESNLGQAFQCTLCDRSYSTSMTLKSHMREKHGKREGQRNTGQTVSNIICDFCHRAFCNKASLKEHVRTRHSDNIQLFKCSLCQMKFTRSNSLQRHMKKSCRMLSPDQQNLAHKSSDNDTSPDITNHSMDMDADPDLVAPGADMDLSLSTDIMSPSAEDSDEYIEIMI